MNRCVFFGCLLGAVFCLGLMNASAELTDLRVAVFDIDATPPVGTQLAYDPMVASWDMSLRARGIVLLGADRPIVLCALDWIGLSNGAYDSFQQTLAEAAGTPPERVEIHVLHQHDAPAADFTIEAMLRARNAPLGRYDGTFARELLPRLKKAVEDAVAKAKPVTQVGLGKAPVYEVASNRRILGADGKVSGTRFTTCKDPVLRAAPEGVIDPEVSVISFWNGEEPLAVLSYYAVHPQSYYRLGIANPDYPGVARFLRQLAVPEALHIHFTGAGANLGAGKYNDGAKVNRGILAERLADGMRRAWESTERIAVTAADISWRVEPVTLPVAAHINYEQLQARFDQTTDPDELQEVASRLAFAQRCHDGHQTNVTCLGINRARVLFMPGELFVEYQLAAKAARPDLFVAMAAYGEYGMGYVGTRVAYAQGGYETGENASYVSPDIEDVLMGAIRKLLDAPQQ